MSNTAYTALPMTSMPGLSDYLLLLAIVASIISVTVATLVVIVMVIAQDGGRPANTYLETWFKLLFGIFAGIMLLTIVFFVLV